MSKYNRTPEQKIIRKANDILRRAEKLGKESAQIKKIKAELEKVNTAAGKRGRLDRFSDSTKDIKLHEKTLKIANKTINKVAINKPKKVTTKKQPPKKQRTNVTRTPQQQLMRKANDILRYAEENKLESDKIVTIKMALEKLNQSEEVNKKGRTDRFADKDLKDPNLQKIYNKLAEELIEEANLPQIFKSSKWKNYGLTKQEYLDMVDKTQAIEVHTLESYGLSSEQIGDIYKLTRGNGWSNDEVEELIHQALIAEAAEHKGQGFTEINPDRLSDYIKKFIYAKMDEEL